MDSLSRLSNMNRHILIVPVLVIAFGFLTWHAAVSSAGSSFAHKTNAIFFFLASIGLVFVSTISVFVLWRQTKSTRYYAILILALSSMLLLGSMWYRGNQHSFVIRNLELTYNSIVKKGAPFPTEAEIQQQYLGNLPDSYSTGYWVSPDRQTFEIYYHDSSDSYTMQFPNGKWDWRGYNYSGPKNAG